MTLILKWVEIKAGYQCSTATYNGRFTRCNYDACNKLATLHTPLGPFARAQAKIP